MKKIGKGFIGKKNVILRKTHEIFLCNRPINSGQVIKELILSTGSNISKFKNFWGSGTADSNSFAIRQKKEGTHKQSFFLIA